MAVGRRYIEGGVPRLTRRSWEDSAQDLENFLRKVFASETDGIPPGFANQIPQTVEAGAAGDAGEQSIGWSAGNHLHPVATGIPVGLGYEAEEGTGTDLARATHVHPYLDLTEDLVVAYRFEEASGIRYPSWGSYLLSENGTVGSNTGKVGNAVEFSGSNNLYLDNGSALQQGSFDFTVCVWAYLDSIAADQFVVAKDSAADAEYALYYDQSEGVFTASLQTTTPNTYTVAATDVTPVVSTWYFIRFWYVHAESNLYIQVNDGAIFSQYCGGETPRVTTNNFMVGAHEDGTETDFIDGRADALHWYLRALSVGEHDILYNGGNGREIWIPLTTPSSSLLVPGGTAKRASGLPVADMVVWEAPYNATVTAVRATRRDGTGATVNMRRNYTDEHLSSDLSLVAAQTTYDGGAVQNAAYAAGDVMELRIKSVAGTPTEISVWARVQKD